jgi:hypothetical protein
MCTSFKWEKNHSSSFNAACLKINAYFQMHIKVKYCEVKKGSHLHAANCTYNPPLKLTKQRQEYAIKPYCLVSSRNMGVNTAKSVIQLT